MKKGISLVIMLVTIAVILILTSVTVVTGSNIYNNTKKVKFASEISYVEEIVNTYRLNNNGSYPSSKLLYVDCSSINPVYLNEQFVNEGINNDILVLYKIDFSMLNPHELMYTDINNDSGDNVYCISPTTGRVYFVQGVKIGRKTYYTLTDDLKKSINYVEDNNVNDGIIFLDDYKGNLKIKIPDEYTDINITSSNGEITVTQDSITEYKIYNVSYTTGSLITVSYKKDNVLKELKYNVGEVSNNKPDFNISEIKTMINSKTGKEEKYVTLENVPNNIKVIKYANQEVLESKVRDYFKKSGIEIKKDDVIMIPNNSLYNIIVYIEDKYGNYNYKKIRIADIDSYIKTNLVLQLDGIKNTRNGHIDTTTLWADLSNNYRSFNLSNFEFGEESRWKNNSLQLDGVDDGVFLGNETKDLFKSDCTIELTFDMEKNDIRDVIMGNFNTSHSINIERANDNLRIYWNSGRPDYSFLDFFKNENKLNMSLVLNQNEGKLDIYKNGIYFNSYINSEFKNYNYDYLNAYIGRDSRTGGICLKGSVYATRMYNKSLTEEEIKHNYEIDKLRFGL